MRRIRFPVITAVISVTAATPRKSKPNTVKRSYLFPVTVTVNPYAILSWRNNWDELTVFFQFPLEIRKIIYTTNLIENLNGKIRKYTKSELSFPSDDAVKKMVYLSLMEIEKKWTMPITNWGLIMNQFMLIFENRIQI